MYELWEQIRIVKFGGKEYRFGSLDVHFSIKFSNESASDIATIKLYNINDDSLSRLKEEEDIVIEAGHKQRSMIIFIGKIDKFSSEIEGIDQVTTIKCSRSSKKWLKEGINKTWQRGSKASDIARDIINGSSYSLGAVDVVNEKVYKNGKTFSTTRKRALEEVAKTTGSKLYATHNKIYLMPYKKSIRQTIKIDKESGLIERPKRLEEGKVQVVMLLRPDIDVDTIIEIESTSINGMYRVVEGEHGAGEINDYYTKVECVKDES